MIKTLRLFNSLKMRQTNDLEVEPGLKKRVVHFFKNEFRSKKSNPFKLSIAKVVLLFLIAGGGSSCNTSSESTSYTSNNVSITAEADSLTDTEFQNILAPYKREIESKLTEVISYSETGLISFRPESPLSNFLSDLILDFAVDFCKEKYPDVNPQISLYNHGGIRSSIPKGNITIGNIFELMPFENELVLVLLTGDQVIELSNYITTRGGEGVSGITFGMNNNRAENVKIQGVKIDADRKYWLIASDYIANGGDGMKVLTWAEKRIDTGAKMREVIIDYMRKMKAENKIVNSKADGRIYNVK